MTTHGWGDDDVESGAPELFVVAFHAVRRWLTRLIAAVRRRFRSSGQS